MNKIKNFFLTLWYYITYPYYRFTTRDVDKKLTQIAAEDRAALLTEKDVVFLKSVGVETDLETLRSGGKKIK